MLNDYPNLKLATYSHTTIPLQFGYLAMGYTVNCLPQCIKSSKPPRQNALLAAIGYHASRCLASIPIVLVGSIATLAALASVALLHTFYNVRQIYLYPRQEGPKIALQCGFQLACAVSTIGLTVLCALAYEVKFLTKGQDTYAHLLEDLADGNCKNSLVFKW